MLWYQQISYSQLDANVRLLQKQPERQLDVFAFDVIPAKTKA